jgi:hypothetical protein
MAGIPFTGADLELKAGLIAQNLWNDLNAAREWYWWIQDHAAVFSTLGISGDQTLITNAASDLAGPAGLWSVAHAKSVPGGASDYFANAKQLTGTNYAGSSIA